MRPLTRDDALYRETRDRLLAGGNISDLISCFAFDDRGPVQAALHRLKYHHHSAVGVELGVLLGTYISLRMAPDPRCVVVPVPLHKAKLRERGFNQSQCICDGIAGVIPCTVLSLAMVRKRYTRSQTTLRHDERRMNVLGAFSVNPRMQEEICESTVIMVDDVITTGATISECASVLLAYGARRVIACSVALAG